MPVMVQKYLKLYTLGISNQLVYRINFIFGRLRGIMLLVLLYFVWLAVSKTTGAFAGFTTNELLMYVLLAHLVRSFVFGMQSKKIAEDINDGSLASLLVKPINIAGYYYARELGERTVAVVSAGIEVILFIWLAHIDIIVSFHQEAVSATLLAVLLAHAIYFCFSYAVNLIAFWSREAAGPRFLFDWFVEFTSGGFFPLNILPSMISSILSVFPFAYVLYIPVLIYLGKITNISQVFVIQIVWLLIALFLVRTLWVKGLRKFSGEGI